MLKRIEKAPGHFVTGDVIRIPQENIFINYTNSYGVAFLITDDGVFDNCATTHEEIFRTDFYGLEDKEDGNEDLFYECMDDFLRYCFCGRVWNKDGYVTTWQFPDVGHMKTTIDGFKENDNMDISKMTLITQDKDNDVIWLCPLDEWIYINPKNYNDVESAYKRQRSAHSNNNAKKYDEFDMRDSNGNLMGVGSLGYHLTAYQESLIREAVRRVLTEVEDNIVVKEDPTIERYKNIMSKCKEEWNELLKECYPARANNNIKNEYDSFTVERAEAILEKIIFPISDKLYELKMEPAFSLEEAEEKKSDAQCKKIEIEDEYEKNLFPFIDNGIRQTYDQIHKENKATEKNKFMLRALECTRKIAEINYAHVMKLLDCYVKYYNAMLRIMNELDG